MITYQNGVRTWDARKLGHWEHITVGGVIVGRKKYYYREKQESTPLEDREFKANLRLCGFTEAEVESKWQA